jgi:hypothetical protein
MSIIYTLISRGATVFCEHTGLVPLSICMLSYSKHVCRSLQTTNSDTRQTLTEQTLCEQTPGHGVCVFCYARDRGNFQQVTRTILEKIDTQEDAKHSYAYDGIFDRQQLQKRMLKGGCEILMHMHLQITLFTLSCKEASLILP